MEGGGQHSAYRMAAPGNEEMHAWISALQRSINKDNAIEEVLERRRAKTISGGVDNNWSYFCVFWDPKFI